MNDQAEVYKRLGPKTLAIFVLQKSGVLFLCIGAIVVSVILLQVAPPEYAVFLNKIIGGIVAASIVIFAGIFSVAYGAYVRYSITLGTDNIKITRGLINEEEIGIPYRRIKDARIERDVADQLLGTSDVIINMSGMDEGGSGSGESVIVLPAIDKDIASHIQDEIVKRAEVEEIHVQPGAFKQ